jgi:hypothetical protein
MGAASMGKVTRGEPRMAMLIIIVAKLQLNTMSAPL